MYSVWNVEYSWVELTPALTDSTHPVHKKMVPRMSMLLNNNNLDRQDTHLGVGSFGLCDGAVKSGAGSEPLRQALVDSAQLLWEDSNVVLQPILLLFLLLDLTVQLLPLGVQVLYTWWRQKCGSAQACDKGSCDNRLTRTETEQKPEFTL